MPAGRPHELTPAIVAQVRDALPRVLYVETAADLIGVHYRTLRRWIKAGRVELRRRDRGQPADPGLDTHCELAGVVSTALAEQQANYLGSIRSLGEAKTWQALAWVLERRWPGQWSHHRKDVRELARVAGDQERRIRELEARLGDPPGPAPDPLPPRRLAPGPAPNVGGDADPGAVYPLAPFDPRHDLWGGVAAGFNARAEEVLLAGPAGTGKTLANLLRVYWVCRRYPGARCLVARKTRESLTETALVTWERDVLGPAHPVLTARLVQRRHRRHYAFPNGSVVALGGLDLPDKILSSEWDLVYVPEATDLTQLDWETLGGRLRAGRVPYQQLIADCNPTSPHHWLYRRCQAGLCRLFPTTHRDNPRYWDRARRAWTDEGDRYVRGRLGRMTGARRKRFLEGVWAAAEGLVYAFDEAHRLPEGWTPDRAWPRVWAIDWGERSPTVLQCWAVDPAAGAMHLYREVFRTHCRADTLGKWARNWLDVGDEPRPVSVVCDHDPDKKLAFEREAGLGLRMADKLDRDRGIQAVQARFDHGPGSPPRIYFRPDALDHPPDRLLLDEGRPPSTVAELAVYSWDPRFLIDTPVADNDHGMDAARYAVQEVDAALPALRGEQTCAYDESAEPLPGYLR